MLSQGEWYKGVPKDPLKNRQFRKATLLRARDDLEFRAGLMAACAEDILFWINTFVYQFNPLKKGDDAAAPFITWDFQEKVLLDTPQDGEPGLLWCYEHNKNLVIQKSRNMGATWLFLIVEDWLCLFHRYVQVLNISRNKEAVDDKSPDSLFWKVRFIHRHLPDWMIGEVTDQSCFFGFQRTESVNTGEATTGKAGVGGRAGLIFVDEVAKIREAAEVRRGTANTADCRFWNSTHEGTGNEFYKLTQTPEMSQRTMHWTEHPEHRKGLYRSSLKHGKPDVLDTDYQFPANYKFILDGSPAGGPFPGLRSVWYDKKCVEIGSKQGVARELDINPSGSVSQFFDPLRILALTDGCREPLWEGDVEVEPITGQFAGLTYRKNGPLRLWFQTDGRERPPRSFFGGGIDVSTGEGATPSCASFFDGKTGRKAAEYVTATLYPDKFARVVYALGNWFKDEEDNPALLCWEMQGPGKTFGRVLRELGYRYFFPHFGGAQQTRYKQGAEPKDGWYPGAGNNRVELEAYRSMLYAGEIVNYSERALEECKFFMYTADGRDVIHQGGRARGEADPTGATANHGDITMADALAAKMIRGRQLLAQEEAKEEVPQYSLAWRRQLVEDRKRAEEEWVYR